MLTCDNPIEPSGILLGGSFVIYSIHLKFNERTNMEIERKLASIRRIVDVQPIPDADRIACYQVDGWKVVDSKDKYQVGDLVVYIECDAWVSTELAPFLSKGKEPRVYKGIPGERLRIQKFKKQVSQGLLLPLSVLWTYTK